MIPMFCPSARGPEWLRMAIRKKSDTTNVNKQAKYSQVMNYYRDKVSKVRGARKETPRKDE